MSRTYAVKIALWSAAQRMITSAPFLGLGLGTFQDAYPMYATQMLPFIMDKAHSDYLEFAAGLGLPWWVPGGGENHPDAVVTEQSIWIDGAPVVADGSFVEPELADLASALTAA